MKDFSTFIPTPQKWANSSHANLQTLGMWWVKKPKLKLERWVCESVSAQVTQAGRPELAGQVWRGEPAILIWTHLIIPTMVDLLHATEKQFDLVSKTERTLSSSTEHPVLKTPKLFRQLCKRDHRKELGFHCWHFKDFKMLYSQKENKNLIQFSFSEMWRHLEWFVWYCLDGGKAQVKIQVFQFTV